MQINIVTCLFVLASEKNDNIRKNDIKKIKVLTDLSNHLPIINYDGKELKNEVSKNIESIIGTNIFHLEQVYTLDYNNSINIIYLAITNNSNITKLDERYKLVDFKVENNNLVTFDDEKIEYQTIEIESNNNIEYTREYKTNNKDLILTLAMLLISYKRIRGNIDHTDIIFKFMNDSFTLEDVRILYELITERKVDKSNFRKKIVKYCEKTTNVNEKLGYRPSQRYKFKPLKGDIWV